MIFISLCIEIIFKYKNGNHIKEMGIVDTFNGWYSGCVFEVEPQVSWLTASELGLNVWLRYFDEKQKFHTEFCIHHLNQHESQNPHCKLQTIHNGQGVLTFGPLTNVLNIDQPPSDNRFVTVRVYCSKSKNCERTGILKLTYKIPDFWPQRILNMGSVVPNFRLVFGSCLRLSGDFKSQPTFPSALYELFKNKIVETQVGPNILNSGVFIIGDTVYLNNYNYDTESGIIARYRQLQKLPQLKGAWSAGATWNAVVDDHDMSINDGTFGAPSINLCMDMFSKVWPNSPFQASKVSPQTFAFTRFDIGFIGLDNRTYRTNSDAPNPTILGEVQFQWLRQILYSFSELTGNNGLIFIFVGTPFLPPGSSSFHEFPIERQRILDLINNELKLTNVFFMSGDSHFSDVSVFGNITEIRCSALSSPPRDPNRYPNPYRIPGSGIMVNNFGVIDLTGTYLQRTISYKNYVQDGSVAFSIDFQQKPPLSDIVNKDF